MAEKLRGRTKENHSGVAIISEKLNILPIELRLQIVSLRNEGRTFTSIHKDLVNNGYNIAYTTVTLIYKRYVSKAM